MRRPQPDPRGYLTEGPDEGGKRPWAKYEADDGTMLYGQEAIAAMNAAWEAGGFSGLQRDVGHGPETHSEWRDRTHDRHRPVQSVGRHRRAPGRRVRRGHGSRRSSASQDPGDGGDGDPQPVGVRSRTYRQTSQGATS